jgi:hypothetical protein
MSLLESDVIKINILRILNEVEVLSMNGLRKKIGAVNYNSVYRNCEFLEMIEFISIEKKMLGSREYNFISITQKGKIVLEGLGK